MPPKKAIRDPKPDPNTYNASALIESFEIDDSLYMALKYGNLGKPCKADAVRNYAKDYPAFFINADINDNNPIVYMCTKQDIDCKNETKDKDKDI